MCATAALASPAMGIISNYCSDIDPFQLLVKVQETKPGSPLPSNVIDNVNPFEREPSSLPDGAIWYLVELDGSKQTDGGGGGVWKEKGEACRIHSGTSITGWRRTHEFHHQGADDARKTGSWVMQEYWMSCEDPIKQMASTNSLCRVFPCDDGEDGNNDLPEKDVTEALTGNKDSKSGQASNSPVQVEREESREDECSPSQDYLELADLDNGRLSSSSCKDSLSSFSRASYEFIDVNALLEEIARDDEACSQLRPVCDQLNVSRPTDADVILSVASAASPEQERIVPTRSMRMEEESVATSTSCHDGRLSNKDCNKRKVEPASSSSDDIGASSSRERPPGSERGKKVHAGKWMKKFFHFMAF